MTNIQMWTLLVGFFMPPVIAVIQQAHWAVRLRALVTFAVCVVASLVTVWLTGEFNTKDVVASILTVLVTALATYRGLWKPTGVAPSIEAATSPTSPEI